MHSNDDVSHVHPVMLPYLRPSGHPDLHCLGQTMPPNDSVDMSGGVPSSEVVKLRMLLAAQRAG